MTKEMFDFILEHMEDVKQETLTLIEELCGIPAPSNHEEKRAEFCKKWLEDCGAEGVVIDSALNVLYPLGCEDKDDIVLFLAHTDTVFPDLEPMPFKNDGEYLYSPGVGDDTTCLAIMLIIVKYIIKYGLKPKCGILFAANAGEEGLGNLKGIKQIMKDYDGRISEVYAFDGMYKRLANKCVGSHRYEIIFETEGGHSFNAFGNRNAIYAMSELVHNLYSYEVPVCGDSKTTYNAGIAEGGTSVNTIAQKARLLYEYRSDSSECLEKMQKIFENEIAKAKERNIAQITVNTIGVRPCSGDVDNEKLSKMSEKCIKICEKYSGFECLTDSASTDCNIPMSMGIPAVCVGIFWGSGTHTREEKVEIASIPVGIKIASELILEYF